MGKYNKMSGSAKGLNIQLKLIIANELVELVEANKIIANNTNDMARQAKESNRLKRLEMTKGHDSDCRSNDIKGSYLCNCYIKDLEDQA